MSPIVRPISAEETLSVRLAVLRPGLPRESAIFDGDDEAEARHFGGFLEDGTLVGVASIRPVVFPEKPNVERTWQLRGMATMPAVRGLGFGRALLRCCEDCAGDLEGSLMWCNARSAAVPFYRRLGWTVIGREFMVPTVGPHFRMELGLSRRDRTGG